MLKFNIVFLFSLLFVLPTSASDKDSNVVISGAHDNYAFYYDKKGNSVKINEELTTTYQCLDYRSSIPIASFCDSKTSIDYLTTVSKNKRSRYASPSTEYYSIDNVFYSDARICAINLFFEKKGATSEVTFEKNVSDPRYFTSIYFSDNYFINSKTVTITVPKWMKVDFKELNFEKKDIRKTVVYDNRKDADIITFTIKNIAPRESERNSPGASYTEPHLLVLCKYADLPDGKITYFNTLDDQYAWYRTLTRDLNNNEAIIQSKAREISAGSNNDMDKIKKLFYWVQDNIRYIAFEDGIAGFKPEKADEVLRKKYGDCKGMAHLTKELLKALGFDARLCWIGTNHIAYDYSTPSIAVDNHMICALIYQGKTYFLDATENYIGFNEYAERIQGRQVLIEDGDKYIYTKVPATIYSQNLDDEKWKVTIKGTSMEGSITRIWKGEEKEYIFSSLNAIKKEKSTEAFIKYLSNDNKDFSITEFSTSDLIDYDKPLSVQYKFNHTNALSSFGNDLYLDIDFRKDLADFTFDLAERMHDYWFSYKVNKQLEVQVILPQGYNITAVPPNVSVKNEDYEFTLSITKQPGKIVYTKNIIIKNPRIKKEKFDQWNKDIAKLKSFYNEQIILTK